MLLAARFTRALLLLHGDATGRAATAQIASQLAGACSITPLLLPAGLQPDGVRQRRGYPAASRRGRKEAKNRPELTDMSISAPAEQRGANRQT